jgi:hypothetical protein
MKRRAGYCAFHEQMQLQSDLDFPSSLCRRTPASLHWIPARKSSSGPGSMFVFRLRRPFHHGQPARWSRSSVTMSWPALPQAVTCAGEFHSHWPGMVDRLLRDTGFCSKLPVRALASTKKLKTNFDPIGPEVTSPMRRRSDRRASFAQASSMVAARSHYAGRDVSSLSACGAAKETAGRFGAGELVIPYVARTSGMLVEVVWPAGMRGALAGQSRPQGHHRQADIHAA